MTLKISHFLSPLRSPPCPLKIAPQNSPTRILKITIKMSFDLTVSHNHIDLFFTPKNTPKIPSFFLCGCNISPSYLEYIIRSGTK